MPDADIGERAHRGGGGQHRTEGRGVAVPVGASGVVSGSPRRRVI